MKNNILKVFAVLLAVMMLFSLASCGEKDKDNGSFESNGTSSVSESDRQDAADTTDDTEKAEGEISGNKDNQAPKVTVGAGAGAGQFGSAKPGGKDTGKDSGKTEDEKQTGSNTSETSKPSGGNGDTSSGEIELPVVSIG